MDQEHRGKINVIAAFAVLVVLGLGALLYKYLLEPEIKESLVQKTGSAVSFDHTLRVGIDSFVGYAILRSSVFRDRLAQAKIGVDLKDDGAKYADRMKALQTGELEMAVFTIDADLIAGTALKEFPGAIALVIDESKGADGIVAYKQAVPNASVLNHPSAKIVATVDSPSETLARHLVAGMLPQLEQASWLVEAGSVDDVYARLKKTNPNERVAFSLWEPALTKALAIPGMHVLYDTSKVNGAIVDVLVVNRKYLDEQPALVRQCLEAYLQTLHFYETQTDGMAKLVRDDSVLTGSPLDEAQAKKIAGTIQWKNTLENYAHMGLVPPSQMQGLMTMPEMIASIAQFLAKTGKFASDPTTGQVQNLYFNGTLKGMQASNFHPGTGALANIRGQTALPALTESQWSMLLKVGDMDARTIGFSRAQATLSVQGERDVKDVVKQLSQWPNYYVTVQGTARAEGDQTANLALATARAKTVADMLTRLGIHANRVRTAARTSMEVGAQSVSFILSQRSY